jgi:aspartyl/asparaginyl-tRNA synthetase
MLEQRIIEKGLEVGPLQSYIDSFKHGVSPHAGAGIGLDRVVFLYLGKKKLSLQFVHKAFGSSRTSFARPVYTHLT